MPFKLENEMVDPVVRWLERRHLTVKREFSLPWGVCDLVGLKFDAERVRQRVLYGQKRPIGPPLRLHILSKIPEVGSRRAITLRQLRAEFLDYLSGELLERELCALERDKFVTSSQAGRFQKFNGWAPLHQSIHAVELKLTRVSEALSQAACNRAFATHSYVALPGKLALSMANSKRAAEFRRTGIGILGVWGGFCREMLKPRSHHGFHDELVQSHVVERFWRTRGSSP